MFTVQQLQERFGCKPHVILHWIRSGQLKAVSITRSPSARKPRWRISKEALEAFETARTASATPAPRRARRAAPDVVQYYS